MLLYAKKYFLFFIFSLVGFSCNKSSGSKNKDEIPGSSEDQKAAYSLSECYEKMPQRIFTDDSMNYSLTSASEKYTASVLEVFKAMPDVIKKGFCSFDEIIFSTALQSLGGFGTAPGAPYKQRFSDKLRIILADDLINYSSSDTLPINVIMKNYFYKSNDNDCLDCNYPYFEITGVPEGFPFALYNIAMHETAHMLDLFNLNIRQDEDGYPSKVLSDEFTMMSWQSPLKEKDDDPLSSFEFHRCNGTECYQSRQKNATELCKRLFDSSFISLYANQNPQEDFAESLTFYYLITHNHFELKLNCSDGHQKFDWREKLSGESFQKKRGFIENFLESHIEYKYKF